MDIAGSAEVEYAGFINGEFLELEQLGTSLKQVIMNAEDNANQRIKEVVIGVPSAFCTVRVKSVNQNFDKKLKINSKIMNELFFIGNDFAKFPTHQVISTNLIDEKLDDGVENSNVLGMTTSTICSRIAYVLCEKRFIEIVTNLLRMLGVKIKAFILSSLAQVKYLLGEKDVENAVILDVGHITSSVSFVNNKSLVAMNEFSLGGGFITSDIMEKFNISFDSAEGVKKKVVLSFTPQVADFYELKAKNEVLELSAISVNNVVRERIVKILKAIYKSLQINQDYLMEDTKFYLTGGGLSYIKGAKDILSNAIRAEVNLLTPNLSQLDKPHYSSVLSLLFLASEYLNLGIKI